MNRILVDIALVLQAHPLISRVQVFGLAQERPDEAETLTLGLIASAQEIDSFLFLSLRQTLLATVRRSGELLRPIVLLDKPAGALWAPKAGAEVWEKKLNAPQIAHALRHGEPFDAWFTRIISPRLTAEGGSSLPPVSPQELRTLRAAIVQHLDPNWLESPYRNHWNLGNPTVGFCSIASEAAFFELGGGPAGWKGMVQREADGTTHWWVEHANGLRFDPTDSQYREVQKVPPYERGMMGRACAFMGMRQDLESRWGFGRKPGLRAAVLLDRLRAPSQVRLQPLRGASEPTSLRRRFNRP